MKTSIKELKNQYWEKYDTVKQLKKLTAKQLDLLNNLQKNDNWSEGLNLLEKIENGTVDNIDFSIEKTEKGVSIFIPTESLLSPIENNEKGFSKIFDLFQWFNRIKGTKKVNGTDGKVYGVQLTILEYK